MLSRLWEQTIATHTCHPITPTLSLKCRKKNKLVQSVQETEIHWGKRLKHGMHIEILSLLYLKMPIQNHQTKT